LAKRYTPEERRGAVEAFLKSGRKRGDFARLWGCSASSLDKWVRRYNCEGPKGLETRRPGRRSVSPANRLPDATRAQIVAVRHEHPEFGAQRVADYLARFHALSVSASTVRNVLNEAGVRSQAAAKKRPRRGPKPARRFERARPGELWQSDITSFVLRRQGRRVYFTVFLDDHSRYIVAWALATHQRTPLVTEPLLEGIARFGKPKEVLTDQGRQYYAWRGKSGFQKLLAKEGIAHVVSRAHHPETLGKCERLWKTVADEFWERAAPQDLEDARRRIAHWVRHYNHFRPHQGIDGLVPADRFFGAESTLREALERELSGRELRLALDEAPRQPVYLVGQIGRERIALHGERGRLVIDTPDGGRRELGLDELGIESTRGERDRDEEHDERIAAGTPGIEHDSRNAAAAANARGPQADGLQVPGDSGLAGEGTVGGGAAGGEGAGTPDLHGDPGVLAGQEGQGRGRARPLGLAAAGLAAQPAGALGDDGGPAHPATPTGQLGGVRGTPGRDASGAEGARRGAREEALAHRGPCAGAADGPVGGSELGCDSERRSEPCREDPTQEERQPQAAKRDEECPSRRASASERSCERNTTRGKLWRRWLKRTQ
jgi:transposase InsO family protein